MKRLYHYTNIHTLCAIVNRITSDKMFLRAGNAKNMNDPNDCYYFINTLGKLINADSSKIEKMSDIKDKFDRPYLVSLTSIKDDLHMWNCYGDNGFGVAIGIDDLQDIARNFYLENKIFTKLYECRYMGDIAIRKNAKIWNLIKNSNLQESAFWQNETISEISNIIKHPCYKYEKEYRIVIKHGEDELIMNDIYESEEDAFYIGIPIKLVKTIIVGPNANCRVVEKIFCQYFPYAKFEQSKIPYRSK